MTSDNPLLGRIRKLLAKAEAQGVTPAEAEALTAKATELMARSGIDRALLAATKPDTDRPGNRIIEVPNPWSVVRAHLLTGVSAAMRCQCVLLPAKGGSRRIHVFGYTSDLERVEILYTSLLVQMAHGLAAAEVPVTARSSRSWRRSWLLGFTSAVTARMRAAEQRAASQAEQERDGSGPTAELVLADRALVIRYQCEQAYPRIRMTRITYTGSGYHTGYAEGQRADIGGARLANPGQALGGGGR